MDTEWISLERAARLKGISPSTFTKRLQRQRVVLMNDREDRRRKLAPVTILTPEERRAWLCEQVSEAIVPGLANPPQALGEPPPAIEALLPFGPPSPSQAERDAVVAAVPRKDQAYVNGWLEEVDAKVNGLWRVYRGTIYGGRTIANSGDFLRARASLVGVSVSNYYSKIGLARQIFGDPTVGKSGKWKTIAEALVPRPRPGFAAFAFFTDPNPEVAWQFLALRGFYLNQARFSVTASHQMLLDLIEKKQRAWGLGHHYPRPSLRQCRIALGHISKPERVLARQGEKAFSDRCGRYLSRDPSTLRSSDLWVTDQKEIDVRLRDGGERLGRIWMVSFLDCASDKILGYSFGPVLSSDMVMEAAAMALARYGIPLAIHMDLGKEFICKAFNGTTRKFSGEVLYREALGLWNGLGVKIIKAIGRNPQAKTIERFHANLPAFDRRFPGYCGSSPDTRPEKLVAEEAQHLAWLAGKTERSPLVTIRQYIRAYITWAEQDSHGWNLGARGRGKMRQGMTPTEAYNVKVPESGFRFLTSDALDHATADHRFVKVARGGQVNLTFYGQTIEYEAPELFHLQGDDVEVIVSRRTLRQVTVLYPVPGGTASCVAALKPLLAWVPENRDELRAALRCKAAVHRAVRQGVRASRLALEAANPVELLEIQQTLPAREQLAGQKLFGVPALRSPLGVGGPDHPETSSTEYVGKRMGLKRTAAEVPVETLADEPSPRDEPSLYTLKPCTAEEL